MNSCKLYLNKESWACILRHCPDFRKYAFTDADRTQHLDLFTRIDLDADEKSFTYHTFGKKNIITAINPR